MGFHLAQRHKCPCFVVEVQQLKIVHAPLCCSFRYCKQQHIRLVEHRIRSCCVDKVMRVNITHGEISLPHCYRGQCCKQRCMCPAHPCKRPCSNGKLLWLEVTHVPLDYRC